MPPDIGHAIRRRRQELGLSLDALAERSGVSSTMLSEVERGVKNPTVKLAYQIARAFGCTLTDLLEEDPEPVVAIVRKDERRTLVDPSTGVARHGMPSQLANRRLEVAWYELPARQSTGEMGPNRPGLLEQISVIRGELTVVLGGEPHVLSAGDSITYGVQSTEYRNDSDAECEFVLLSDASGVRD